MEEINTHPATILSPIEAEVRNASNAVVLKVQFQPGDAYIYCNWIGFIQEVDAAKEACNVIVEAVKKTGCAKILNDNRQQTGPWPPLDEWLNTVWFPALQQAGLKYLAHVYSPNVFTQISANNHLKQMVLGIQSSSFKEEADAIAWLEKK